MKPTNNRVFISLFAALSLVAVSCNESTKFSTVLDGGYDPVAAFRKQGYTVQAEANGARIRNAEHGYGWQSWCGSLTGAQKPLDCSAIASVIRDELNRALSDSSLDELTVGSPSVAGQPLTGMLRYNKDHMHGDLHVWLIPDASNTTVSFAIYMREERLK